jgi:NTP pyrophosphatase (non-canonical NTP hydrolase)
MALFKDETQLLAKLLQEWYAEIKTVTLRADGIFSAKGKMYDLEKPAWDRMKWPFGFVHEITKKAGRVEQLFTQYTSREDLDRLNWDDIEEELLDILNYCRMLAAVNRMQLRRHAEGLSDAEFAELHSGGKQ